MSLRENKKKKKQDIRVVSTEFTIDFSRGDHYKGRKKSYFIYLSFSRPAHDSMIKNSQFELSYSSLMS